MECNTHGNYNYLWCSLAVRVLCRPRRGFSYLRHPCCIRQFVHPIYSCLEDTEEQHSFQTCSSFDQFTTLLQKNEIFFLRDDFRDTGVSRVTSAFFVPPAKRKEIVIAVYLFSTNQTSGSFSKANMNNPKTEHPSNFQKLWVSSKLVSQIRSARIYIYFQSVYSVRKN